MSRSQLRFRDGGVTVTLDDGIERFVRKALDAVAGETVRILEQAAEEVDASAGAAWYEQVTRRSGTSGNIERYTTVSDKEVRVSVGSTDLAKAKYVHRPGPLSTVVTEIPRREYEAMKKKGGAMAKLVFRAKRNNKAAGIVADRCYRIVSNPKASDGKYLLAELIRKPMKAKVKKITPEIGRAIAARVGGGR